MGANYIPPMGKIEGVGTDGTVALATDNEDGQDLSVDTDAVAFPIGARFGVVWFSGGSLDVSGVSLPDISCCNFRTRR